jgi:hypothetical protein
MKTDILGDFTPADYGPEYLSRILNIQPMSAAKESCLRLYRVLFMPSWHPEACITVQIQSDYSCVNLITMQTNIWYYVYYHWMKANEKWFPESPHPSEPSRWEETQQARPLLITDFLSQVDELQPESISDLALVMMDGMRVQGEYSNVSGQHNSFQADFFVDSKQYQFSRAVYQLATEVLKEEKSIRILEDIHGYLGGGLPAKNLGGNPYCVRIFGTLSSRDQDDLQQFLDELPKSTPLLVDMSNFDGMGTLLYPIFQQFMRRRQASPTTWWTSYVARRHLEALGVPSSSIFDNREAALAGLSR